jgi:lysophospholipase L1-like esterase
LFLVKLISIVAAVFFIWKFSPFPATGAGRLPSAAVGSAVRSGPSYLALGDSYTCGESVNADDRYPVQAAHLLNQYDQVPCQDPDILAVTGWTTGNLLNALLLFKTTQTYGIVTLLIGVNNQFRGYSQSQYREQFTLILQRAISLAGDRPSRVLVLSIPDWSVTPFGRSRDTALNAAQIDSFNVINHSLALEYKVNYLDVTAESRKAATDPSLIAGDGLHFSAKEYEIWARLMEPVMKGMLH